MAVFLFHDKIRRSHHFCVTPYLLLKEGTGEMEWVHGPRTMRNTTKRGSAKAVGRTFTSRKRHSKLQASNLDLPQWTSQN